MSGSGSKRRMFIGLVNRGLERVLNVGQQDYSGANDSRQSIDQQEESSTTTALYEDDYEKFFRTQRRINEVRRLLLLLPRGLRARLNNSEVVTSIRQLLADINLSELPGDLLDQLKDFNFFN